MARRRSSHLSPWTPSSNDLEESVPPTAGDDDETSHPISLAASPRGSPPGRCHRGRRPARRWKAVLACIGSIAAIALLTTSRPTRSGARGTRSARGVDDANGDSRGELLRALLELPLPATHEELEELNEELIDLDPRFILEWARHHVASPQLVQVTSFGPTGLVILHMLSELHLLKYVPIVTMDTLHLFPESYDFHKKIRSYYDGSEPGGDGTAMELVVTKPLRIGYPPAMNGDGVVEGVLESRGEFEASHGAALWRTDPQKFTQLTKVEPLGGALDVRRARMWITGRRRSSGGDRSGADVLEFEPLASSAPDRGGGAENPFVEGRGRW